MPLIKPPKPLQHDRKRITIDVTTELWNEICAAGVPRDVLNGILEIWMMERMQGRGTYFTTTKRKVVAVADSEYKRLESSEEYKIRLTNELLRAESLGWGKKAARIKKMLERLDRINGAE